MPGAAAPVPGVAVAVELVTVDETGVLVALVVAVAEVNVLEVAPLALVTLAVAFVVVAKVVDIVYRKTQKTDYFELLASEVVNLGETTTLVHDCMGVSKLVRHEIIISFLDLS